MGTRNLTAVMLDGEYRVAQYCQWDGYPKGQGKTVLEFLHDWDRDVFTEKVRSTQWMSNDDLTKLWQDVAGADATGLVNMEQAKLMEEKYPQFCRNMGAMVLWFICEGPMGQPLTNSIEFANGGLWCEWAYVVDLDRGTFEVYRGRENHPLTDKDRFHFLLEEGNEDDRSRWGPVSLFREYKLDALPTVEEYLAEMDNLQEKEDL